MLTEEGLRPAALLIDGEKITAVRGWDDVGGAAEKHDAGDLVVLPGLVDSHVHINDPGRDWEGFDTATRAAAAGGVTTLVDMPLNCVPETINADALDAKRAAAKAKAWVDWAAWGGVVRGNAEELRGLVAAGVPGFKCFLIDSGIEGFAWVEEADLRKALEKLRGTGLPLLAHAELAHFVDVGTRTANAYGIDWRKYSTHAVSRPDVAELQAIGLLIRLAEEFSAPVHVVHLSSAQALPMLVDARSRGVPVTVETCPHYLWFAAEGIPDGATEFKCMPPIRLSDNRERLWQALEEGTIDLVVTDHSPCSPEMKRRDTGRFDEAWGGIASLGLSLPVMWTALHERGFNTSQAAERVGKWMAAGPARLAGLERRKGVLAAGADADIVIFDPDATWTVTPDDLQFRHKLSPYLGARLQGRVRETGLRGELVYLNSQFTGSPSGRELVRT